MTVYLDRNLIKIYDRKNPILQNGDIYINVEGAIIRLIDLHNAVEKSQRYMVDKYIYSLTSGFKPEASDKYIKQHTPDLIFKWREY